MGIELIVSCHYFKVRNPPSRSSIEILIQCFQVQGSVSDLPWPG